MPNRYKYSNSTLKHQTRLASGLIPLLNMVNDHGQDTKSLLSSVGIKQSEFLDPAFTITLEKELSIVEKCLAYFKEPTPGIALARYYHLHNFSVLGLAIRACSNIGEAFEIIRNYPRLQWGICETSGYLEGETIIFELKTGKTRVEQFLLERDMACVKTLFSEALNITLPLEKISFSFADNGQKQAYEEFFNCPVAFDVDTASLRIPLSSLEIPIPTADPLSLAFYEAQCARLSAEIDDPFQYTYLVRDYLSRMTPIPTLEQLSDVLDIEPRTLQRHLKKESQTFSQILKDVRFKRAQDRLLFSNMHFENIAAELGFNDAAAFSHAFKQWTNLSPRQWRDQHREQLE